MKAAPRTASLAMTSMDLGEQCLLVLVSLGLFLSQTCLQCFDAVGWAAGRASGL